MNVAIISDTHDRMDNIKKAVHMLSDMAPDMIIHCGDFVAPFSIPPFGEIGVPFVSVFGNNDGEKKGLTDKITGIGGIVMHPPVVRSYGSSTFLLCHEPISDENPARYFNDVDFYLYGHTHEKDERTLNGIKIINPGEVCDWLSGTASFALLDTETRETSFIDL